MTMTREELQRLYDDCQDGRYGHLVALVDGVRRYLAEPDPTVEIAYLKATLADVEAECDQLRLSDAFLPEGVGIVMGRLRDYKQRAEEAEQTIQRVRWQCDSWSHGNSWNKAARRAILRALDGGEH